MTDSRAPSLSQLFRHMMPYVRRQKSLYAAAILLLPLTVILPLAPPRMVERIVDRELVGAGFESLALWTAALAGVVILTVALNTLFQYILRVVGLRLMRDLRSDLFDHLQRLPLEYFRHEPRGRIVSRFTTDLEQIDQMFASGGVMLLSELFSVVAIGVAMIHLESRLGLFGLSVVPVVMAVTVWLSARLKAVMRDLRRQMAGMNGAAQETLSAHEVVSVMGAEREFARRFDDLSAFYQKTSIIMNRYEAAFFAAIELFSSFAIAMILLGAAGRGDMVTAGLLIAMTQYIQQFFVPLRGISTRFSTFQQAFVALERVDAFLRIEPEADTDRSSDERTTSIRSAEALVIDDLAFRYREDRPVLENVHLTISPGIHTAMLGETGSGKSTLARILLGFYAPRSGSISWGERPLATLSLRDRRRLITLVPQEVFLFDAALEDNVALGRSIAPDRLRAILTEVGLDPTAARGESGERLGEWGRRLSEGEKQLIAAARVLAYDPALVILDEATSALDPLLDARVRAAIRRALEGRSAIIIAHRLSTLESADRIAVMRRGSVVEEGTHSELHARGGVYAKLHRLMELDSLALFGASSVPVDAVEGAMASEETIGVDESDEPVEAANPA